MIIYLIRATEHPPGGTASVRLDVLDHYDPIEAAWGRIAGIERDPLLDLRGDLDWDLGLDLLVRPLHQAEQILEGRGYRRIGWARTWSVWAEVSR